MTKCRERFKNLPFVVNLLAVLVNLAPQAKILSFLDQFTGGNIVLESKIEFIESNFSIDSHFLDDSPPK